MMNTQNAHTHKRSRVHINIHAYTHTYIHTYIRTHAPSPTYASTKTTPWIYLRSGNVSKCSSMRPWAHLERSSTSSAMIRCWRLHSSITSRWWHALDSVAATAAVVDAGAPSRAESPSEIPFKQHWTQCSVYDIYISYKRVCACGVCVILPSVACGGQQCGMRSISSFKRTSSSRSKVAAPTAPCRGLRSSWQIESRNSCSCARSS